MIRLQRVRTQQAVARAFTGRGLQANSLCLLRRERMIRRGTLAGHSFSRNVWKTAKPQLLRETHGKCAYCEASTAEVSYGDVEHYRPKSRYWWLAYCLDNLLASCQLCNQRFKGASFPRDGSQMAAPPVTANSKESKLKALARTIAPDPLDQAAIASFETLHRQEKPLLINPYVDNPRDHFAWRADEALGEVDLIPRTAGSKKYVDVANQTYGLNRLDLKRRRFDQFRVYRVFVTVLSDNRVQAETRKKASHLISKMQQSDQRYAGMIRFFAAAGEPAQWESRGFFVPEDR